MIEEHIVHIKRKLDKRKPQKFIRSPLNYTGNKYRILEQIIPHMPSKMNVFVDLFSGGATVGLNVDANEVVFVDNDPKVVSLLKHLASYKKIEDFLANILSIILEYGLSLSSVYGYTYYKLQANDPNINNGLKKYNEKGFYLLRESYNGLKDKSSARANDILYVLMVYAFNNDIRFSSNGNFNLPVGKTDFNLNNALKIKEYISRIEKINARFICGDFMSKEVKYMISTADFIYMDPPYLITHAVYNESNKWTNNDEHRLLDFIDNLILKDINFMLSNVIEKSYKKNEPLSYWVKKKNDLIQVINIEYHYRSSSYNKKNRDGKEQEIIIVPKRSR